MLFLAIPAKEYEESYIQAVREFQVEGWEALSIPEGALGQILMHLAVACVQDNSYIIRLG